MRIVHGSRLGDCQDARTPGPRSRMRVQPARSACPSGAAALCQTAPPPAQERMLTQVYIHFGVALRGPRQLPVALRAAAGAALPRLSRRHDHRADRQQGWPRRASVAPRGAGLRLLRAGVHHRIRRLRRGRVGVRTVDRRAQEPARRRRRHRHHSVRPALPRPAAHPVCSTARRASARTCKARASPAPT